MKYNAVGFCVYCGSRDELSDEHIIPYGLNGNRILPQASCKKCAETTSRFERTVLKEDTQHVRTALNFKTRRPKDRPKTLPLVVTIQGKEQTIQVPPNKHLVVFPFPLFKMPGYLEGRPAQPGIPVGGFVSIHFGPHPQKLMAEFKADKVGVELKLDPLAFARMLAKIAHCTVVAELGADALAENFVLPAIRGESEDLGRWVGSGGDATPPTPSEITHSAIYSVYSRNTESVLIVLLKLFANTPAPAYAVVVGRPRPGLTIPSGHPTVSL
jgi:hypothetical protein